MEELDYQQKFEQLFTTHIRREGAEQLLEWLKKTDFFTAPASTKYHCACQHGLVMHSISVFETMVDRFFEEGDSMESFAICALLHDVCKAQFYKVSFRNVKNPETGRWEAQPYSSIDDQFPFGHGEKSVFLIERFLRLKPSEAVAIRWHMGGFDDAARGGSFSISQAYEKYPLAVKLHLADVYSTYLKEKGTSVMR